MRTLLHPQACRRLLHCGAALLCLLGLASTPSAHANVVDRIAATVNEDIILLSDIYEVMGPYLEAECPVRTDECVDEVELKVLDELIRLMLIAQELKRLDVDVTAAQLDAEIDRIARDNDFPTRDAFRSAVESQGVSWSTYREDIKAQIRRMNFGGYVLRHRVSVSDDEVADAYTRLVRTIEPPKLVQLDAFGHVLPEDMPVAQRMELLDAVRADLRKVKQGEQTWTQVATKWDSAGMARLFDGVTFKTSDLSERIAAAVKGLEIGAVAEPVIQDGVLFGVRLVSERDGEVRVPPLDDVRERLSEEIFQVKVVDAEQAWYEQARRRASVKIHSRGE